MALYTAIALDGKRDHFGTGGTWRLDGEALRQAQDDATLLAIREQENASIDIISDGEQRRMVAGERGPSAGGLCMTGMAQHDKG